MTDCLWWLAGYLRGDFQAPTPVNFMVFGSKGSGKSSLLNAIVTCLSLNKKPSRPFTVADSPEHVTTFYAKAILSDFIRDDERMGKAPKGVIQPVAYDTWGTSDRGEYKLLQLKHFLSGAVQPGAEMTDPAKFLRPADRADEIHVIVFVVKLTSSMEDGVLEDISKAMMEATRERNPPLPLLFLGFSSSMRLTTL